MKQILTIGRKPVFTLNNPMVMVTAQTASNIL